MKKKEAPVLTWYSRSLNGPHYRFTMQEVDPSTIHPGVVYNSAKVMAKHFDKIRLRGRKRIK